MDDDLSFRASGYPECADWLIAFRNLNRAVSRDRDYFDWRYLQRPCAKPPTVVWAERAGLPVGALSIFPHDYFVVDRARVVGVIGDISVREDCRGMGIATRMYRYAASLDSVRELQGCLVLPNPNAASSLAKAGWRDAVSIDRAAKVIDYASRVPGLAGAEVRRTLAAPFNALVRMLSAESRFRPGPYVSVPVRHFDDRFDDLWRRARKEGTIVGLRDARYLRWRYETHPLSSFRILGVLKEGRLHGYGCYRSVGDVVLVDDLFCEDWARDGAALVGLLLRAIRSIPGVSTVSVMASRGTLFSTLHRFGFVTRSDRQRVMVSPDGAAGPGWAGDDALRWHLTAGDKDV